MGDGCEQRLSETLKLSSLAHRPLGSQYPRTLAVKHLEEGGDIDRVGSVSTSLCASGARWAQTPRMRFCNVAAASWRLSQWEWATCVRLGLGLGLGLELRLGLRLSQWECADFCPDKSS